MTNTIEHLLKIDKTSSTSIGEQVYNQLSTQIASKQLAEGSRLPTLRHIEKKYDLSMSTIRRAFNRLEKDGYITRKPHLGTFVNTLEQLKASSPMPDMSHNEHNVISNKLISFVVDNDTVHNHRLRHLMEIVETNITSQRGSCSIVTYSQDDFNEELLQKDTKLSEGLIFLPSQSLTCDQFLEAVLSLDKPVVAYDYRGSIRVSTISKDWNWMMHEILEYLARLGHRNIAFASFEHDSASCYPWQAAREKAYIELTKKMKLPVNQQDIFKGFLTMTDQHPFILTGKEVAKKMMDVIDKYSAIIAVNDGVAFGMMEVFKKNGITIPDDISIIGFDNDEIAFKAGLSTVVHAFEDDAKSILETLQLLLQAGDKEKIINTINKPKLIARQSTTALKY